MVVLIAFAQVGSRSGHPRDVTDGLLGGGLDTTSFSVENSLSRWLENVSVVKLTGSLAP